MPRLLTQVIVRPGKRPGRRLAKSKVFGAKFMKGKHGTFADLNLTPMVDMFTMLVIYLIQQFSASGELLFASKDIQMPKAANGDELVVAPVVAISPDVIVVEGNHIADIAEISKDDFLDLPPLEEALREQKKRYELVHQGDMTQFKGEVNVQADSSVPFKVVKRVMYSCSRAGFANINFAVNEGGEHLAEAVKADGAAAPTE